MRKIIYTEEGKLKNEEKYMAAVRAACADAGGPATSKAISSKGVYSMGAEEVGRIKKKLLDSGVLSIKRNVGQEGVGAKPFLIKINE